MLVLSDNDIFCKLFACQIFEEVLELLGCVYADVRVLRSSKFTIGSRAKPTNRVRKQIVATYGEAMAEALGMFLERFPEMQEPSTATDHLLVDVTGIDAGEAEIFRLAYESPNALVATCDKRALRQLLSDPACETVRSAISGRVVVLETALLGLISMRGYAWVREHVAPHRAIDRVLGFAFSGGLETPEQQAAECLNSYSKDLGPLLVPVPRARPTG